MGYHHEADIAPSPRSQAIENILARPQGLWPDIMQGNAEAFEHGEYFFEVANSFAKLFVFDLDGTLADTSQDIAVTLQETWHDLGYGPIASETIISHIGHGAEHLIAACLLASLTEAQFEKTDKQVPLRRFLERYAAAPSRFAKPYAGVFDLLRGLSALQPRPILAVLTNKPETPAEGLLRDLQMRPYFAEVIGGDSGYGLKPGISGLQHLMQKFSCPAEKTCLIGDGPQDAEAAEKANIRFYGFLGGLGQLNPSRNSAQAHFFGTFPELSSLLLPQV